jgi:hypothetical protein
MIDWMYKNTTFRCYIKIILAIFEGNKWKSFQRLTLAEMQKKIVENDLL